MLQLQLLKVMIMLRMVMMKMRMVLMMRMVKLHFMLLLVMLLVLLLLLMSTDRCQRGRSVRCIVHRLRGASRQQRIDAKGILWRWTRRRHDGRSDAGRYRNAVARFDIRRDGSGGRHRRCRRHRRRADGIVLLQMLQTGRSVMRATRMQRCGQEQRRRATEKDGARLRRRR